ncbi:hypothetical protein JD844_010685 [Phrynosoma platyrhinos]|uniref:ITPR-interacting domain-containing protein n=1 Tax=Phrynosoma platyrhinos TaxID=52577 RepID=A0ABQ7THT7_PHRPL|nr:hypothetical protein JD844_010685 [Phrynosoma platyrhinos]
MGLLHTGMSSLQAGLPKTQYAKIPRIRFLRVMDRVTSWLGQSSWERRKAWAKQRSTWPTVEEEISDAPQDTLDPQASLLEHGFLQGISSDKIESWLEECSSSVEPLAESTPALPACGSCSNRTSFEDDLTLGAEAMLLLDKDRAESSISEVLDLCEVDAETILCNLGFSQDEQQATSWIPARFFSVPSQAKGIDFQLFLRAQVKRIEMEDPCLILARVSDMQVPTSRLEQIVREVMSKACKDRLDEAQSVTSGDPFSQTKMESASSKSTTAESTLVASPCFCCETQSWEKTDLMLPGLRQWLTSCTTRASRDVTNHNGYQELFHCTHLSSPSVSSPDESSEKSDEESSESTEKGLL